MDLYTQNRLREALISLPGVPNATYQHQSGKVFVFALFFHLVTQEIKKNTPLVKAVRRSLPHSWVPPLVAVQKFSIMPSGFVVAKTESQHFVLYHERLSAHTAEIYPSVADAELAASHLICAQQPNTRLDAHFFHAGLPMRFLLEPKAVTTLAPPIRPCQSPYPETELERSLYTAPLRKARLPVELLNKTLQQHQAFNILKLDFERALRSSSRYRASADFFEIPPPEARLPESEVSFFSQIALAALSRYPERQQALMRFLPGDLLMTHLDSVGVWIAAYSDHAGTLDEAITRGLDGALWWLRVYPELQCILKASANASCAELSLFEQGVEVVATPLTYGVFEA